MSTQRQQTDMKVSYSEGNGGTLSPNARNARFTLDDRDKLGLANTNIMDRIFYDIVGKDNIPTKIKRERFEQTLYKPGTKVPVETNRYTRSADLGGKDAMGNKFMMRGFNDANMWTAQTTQSRVAPIITKTCKRQKVEQFFIAICLSIGAVYKAYLGIAKWTVTK